MRTIIFLSRARLGKVAHACTRTGHLDPPLLFHISYIESGRSRDRGRITSARRPCGGPNETGYPVTSYFFLFPILRSHFTFNGATRCKAAGPTAVGQVQVQHRSRRVPVTGGRETVPIIVWRAYKTRSTTRCLTNVCGQRTGTVWPESRGSLVSRDHRESTVFQVRLFGQSAIRRTNTVAQSSCRRRGTISCQDSGSKISVFSMSDLDRMQCNGCGGQVFLMTKNKNTFLAYRKHSVIKRSIMIPTSYTKRYKNVR
jgi:hypothetical protein